MSSSPTAQISGILRLELSKNLLSVRAMPIYLLAAMAPLVVVVFVLVSSVAGTPSEFQGPAGAPTFFAIIFQFILNVVIYFGCVWLFMNLFRGEVLDRSLHYYFLTPVRREVLVAGKYLSALVSAFLVFAVVTGFCFIVLYSFLDGWGGGGSAFGGPGLGHLIAYLSVVALACLGYGAVFLVVGLFLRNPIVPAFGFFLWEGINPFLPGLLKKISVIFYLQSLFPVRLSEGPLALIVEPISPWLGVPGLALFTVLTLVVAALRIRRMEVSYATD
jgi:ABC-type transport system involved in multi-copper enzyme maturation permease subunit